jgi:hypothetical protein
MVPLYPSGEERAKIGAARLWTRRARKGADRGLKEALPAGHEKGRESWREPDQKIENFAQIRLNCVLIRAFP